jgi:Protein of unknown function (DUF732)
MSWSMAKKAALAGVLSAALGAALTSAPAAHADVRSYMAYLASHHINTGLNTPKTNIYTGLKVCELLHEGRTPEQIAQGVTSTADMPGMITAAQHELCADTLH